MKKMYTGALLLAVLTIAGQMFAQTVTNVEALNQLAEEFAAEWDAGIERVKQYAIDHNVPVRKDLDDGRTMEMIDVQDGKPVYYITDSHGAAITTRASEMWPGGSSGYEISGEGYNQLGQWDGGNVRVSHQEFTDQGPSRVTNQDGSGEFFHAVNVAGVMVSAGIEDDAKGSAYASYLKAWNWGNDNNEMAAAAAAGLEVSNSSYGRITGWHYNSGWTWYGNSGVDPNEDYYFGFYDNDARQVDQIAYNAPNYLIVRSAGNDRGEGPGGSGPEVDGGNDGFDCISHDEIAKNVMTVGAVYQVDNYTGPGDVSMVSFSCWGPADDGRIKPDIMGKGINIYTANSGGDESYVTTQGTSFSSPNVAASAALLQQHYQTYSGGTPMRAATLKGLILHTADECGPDIGPDYMYGWGLMNTKRAANLITDAQGQVSIDERELEQGDAYTRQISVPDGVPELRVSISWTDPPGIPVGAQLNPRDPMLINDLDLKVSKGGDVSYPYSLDPDDPADAATNYWENDVDNFELVYIENPDAGTYTIVVDHDGILSGAKQAYTLIINGIDEYTVTPECTYGLNNPDDGQDDILLNEWITWEPAAFASSYDIYFGTDGGGTETPTNIYNGENMGVNGFTYLMDPLTTYYLQVVPKNDVGEATGCDDIYSFTTMDAINQFPYVEGFDDAVEPDLIFGWQAKNFSEAKWVSTEFIGHDDKPSLLCFNPLGIVETDYDNWLVSPPFEVEDGKEYNIDFFYKAFFSGTSESMTAYWGPSPYPEDFVNVLVDNPDFSSSSWLEGNTTVVPGYNGVMFLGVHVTSQQAYGMFFDDVTVEDWGPVGIGPGTSEDVVHIYQYAGKVNIMASDNWNGADIRILNIVGQSVYDGEFNGYTSIDLGQNAKPGLYIVTLIKGNETTTKKIMIQ